MRTEAVERKRAGREWQPGRDKRAGEGEGEEWTAWFGGDEAQNRRGEITRVLRGLAENKNGRDEGAK